MTNNWRSWCWHLGLASFLAFGGAITYSGKYAFAQVIDCNSMEPMSIEYLHTCNPSLIKPSQTANPQPGNPGGAEDDRLATAKLQLQQVLPSATIPTVRALRSATVLTPQALPSATIPTVRALRSAHF